MIQVKEKDIPLLAIGSYDLKHVNIVNCTEPMRKYEIAVIRRE
ncbi:hypothetical protein Sbs19_45130 [Sphingobium sp. BS19]|nr:hypothetical protein Sbs19_45130 [Sphingobium sp. BS19]